MSNDITDLTPMTAPKSDQINADDLIGGPITVTVERVVAGPAEQPIEIRLLECKPYRPGKSMARVLSSAWGKDPRQWPRPARMTLYRDPDVMFGGVKVGGIRISHMSHIAADLALSLTATRGKRKPFTVRKLAASQAAPAPAAAYPADQFAAKLPAMRQAIADGKMTAEQVIARCEPTGALTAEQRAQITAPIQAETTEEEVF
jgi:hypothetical protein